MRKYAVHMVVIAVLCIFIGIGLSLRNRKPAASSMEELVRRYYPNSKQAGMSDYVQFDFDQLFERADTVAIVTPVNQLSAEDSSIVGDEVTGNAYYAMYSTREVKAMKYFKNNKNYSDSFEMGEHCILTKEGHLIYNEGAYPMIEGSYYLVFLTDSYLPNSLPFAMSVDNGLIDLSHLSISTRKGIAAKSVISFFDVDIPDNLKKAILLSDYLYTENVNQYNQILEVSKDLFDNNTYTLETGYEAPGYELVVSGFKQEDGSWLIKIGDTLFVRE